MSQQLESESLKEILNRRMAKFTLDVIGSEIKIKIKASSKVNTYILDSFEPELKNMLVCSAGQHEETNDFKEIKLEQIDYFVVSIRKNKESKDEYLK